MDKIIIKFARVETAAVWVRIPGVFYLHQFCTHLSWFQQWSNYVMNNFFENICSNLHNQYCRANDSIFQTLIRIKCRQCSAYFSQHWITRSPLNHIARSALLFARHNHWSWSRSIPFFPTSIILYHFGWKAHIYKKIMYLGNREKEKKARLHREHAQTPSLLHGDCGWAESIFDSSWVTLRYAGRLERES